MRRMFTEKQVKKLAQEKTEELDLQNETQVKALIQADKDILSQIVYDEETHIITFPKYVKPLVFIDYSGDMFYFDYQSMKVLDNTGSEELDFEIDDDVMKINNTVEEVIDLTEISDCGMDFIYFNLYDSGLNTYYLYNPITSADLPPNVEDAESGTIADVLGLNSQGALVKGSVGSKLYGHNLRFSFEVGQTTYGVDAKIYSTKATAYISSEIDSMSNYLQFIAVSISRYAQGSLVEIGTGRIYWGPMKIDGFVIKISDSTISFFESKYLTFTSDTVYEV